MYGRRYRQRRAELLAGNPWCAHCTELPAEVADHQPPLCLHDHREGSGCCVLVPSCRRCSYRQAGLLGGARRLSEIHQD
jgi:hypothetical protein